MRPTWPPPTHDSLFLARWWSADHVINYSTAISPEPHRVTSLKQKILTETDFHYTSFLQYSTLVKLKKQKPRKFILFHAKFFRQSNSNLNMPKEAANVRKAPCCFSSNTLGCLFNQSQKTKSETSLQVYYDLSLSSRIGLVHERCAFCQTQLSTQSADKAQEWRLHCSSWM